MSKPSDHKKIERLLVYGEMARSEEGPMFRRWPSIREVAERFGVPKSTVGDLVVRHNVVGRRFLFEQTLNGRPGHEDDQAIHAGSSAIWARVDTLLVHGEMVDQSGVLTQLFPACEALAVRFDLHAREVYEWAAEHGCYDRRETFLERVEDVFDQGGAAEIKDLKQRIQRRALQTTMALLDQAYEAATSRHLQLKASDITRLLADVRHLRLSKHEGATSIEDVVAFLNEQLAQRKGDSVPLKGSSPEERGEVLHLTGDSSPGHPSPDDDDTVH